MRRPGRQEEGRIRRGRHKKLTAAFRYDLKRKGLDTWLLKLAAQYPNEFPNSQLPSRPVEAKAEAWHSFYWRAWEALRFDRHYGAFGGESPISFVTLDTYARRYGIEGEAFENFHRFMTAIDTEWLLYRAEKDKEEEAARK
ncbi:hypothetical protein [Mesorhizobium sp. B2-3-6]|uniref:phage tail assembly chaperone n=1 Tax=Mesorhizobium sp. B2-3-6 TaxID=2589957 RepID=UPI00112C7856|nr:hypothetical protein [Mesorhizobium sp. B2-3-6]TPM19772.1 hypothetical protein FJ953_15335 [Mesorhizobium sp. B2-3-6]